MSRTPSNKLKPNEYNWSKCNGSYITFKSFFHGFFVIVFISFSQSTTSPILPLPLRFNDFLKCIVKSISLSPKVVLHSSFSFISQNNLNVFSVSFIHFNEEMKTIETNCKKKSNESVREKRNQWNGVKSEQNPERRIQTTIRI